MIRYETTRADLEQAIRAIAPTWLDRAAQRTAAFIAAGEYNENSSIWSEVKPVYMELQRNKCAYCERRLASPDFGGAIEHDLEHFRPKNSVPHWPTEQIAADRGMDFTFATGESLDDGYFWLAYDLLNYSAACKKCNTPLKLNYFPVAAGRGSAPQTVQELNAAERPFLLYPIGADDEDSEQIITFIGVTAVPVKKNGPRWRRARVTIEFFELNRREELLRERAEALVSLDNALAVLESGLPDDRKDVARADIERMQRDSSPHASCVRSACRLYVEGPADARAVFAAAREYLDSLG